MSQHYILRRDGRDYQAPDLETMRQWAQDGRVLPTDMVFTPRYQSWYRARDLRELRDVLPADESAATVPPVSRPPQQFWVRKGDRNYVADSLQTILQWASEGNIAPDDLIFHPSYGKWFRAGDSPQLATRFPSHIGAEVPFLPEGEDPMASAETSASRHRATGPIRTRPATSPLTNVAQRRPGTLGRGRTSSGPLKLIGSRPAGAARDHNHAFIAGTPGQSLEDENSTTKTVTDFRAVDVLKAAASGARGSASSAAPRDESVTRATQGEWSGDGNLFSGPLTAERVGTGTQEMVRPNESAQRATAESPAPELEAESVIDEPAEKAVVEVEPAAEAEGVAAPADAEPAPATDEAVEADDAVEEVVAAPAVEEAPAENAEAEDAEAEDAEAEDAEAEDAEAEAPAAEGEDWRTVIAGLYSAYALDQDARYVDRHKILKLFYDVARVFLVTRDLRPGEHLEAEARLPSTGDEFTGLEKRPIYLKLRERMVAHMVGDVVAANADLSADERPGFALFLHRASALVGVLDNAENIIGTKPPERFVIGNQGRPKMHPLEEDLMLRFDAALKALISVRAK
ncbi:MAG: hypothetical protein KC620_15270 [Myxococcales bacterium]|nr:hypothetical protein [Myxococcales bacterium]